MKKNKINKNTNNTKTTPEFKYWSHTLLSYIFENPNGHDSETLQSIVYNTVNIHAGNKIKYGYEISEFLTDIDFEIILSNVQDRIFELVFVEKRKNTALLLVTKQKVYEYYKKNMKQNIFPIFLDDEECDIEIPEDSQDLRNLENEYINSTLDCEYAIAILKHLVSSKRDIVNLLTSLYNMLNNGKTQTVCNELNGKSTKHAAMIIIRELILGNLSYHEDFQHIVKAIENKVSETRIIYRTAREVTNNTSQTKDCILKTEYAILGTQGFTR